mgnify:CR=1 FL=1
MKSAIVAFCRFLTKLVFIGQLLLNFIVQIKRCVMLTVLLEKFLKSSDDVHFETVWS